MGGVLLQRPPSKHEIVNDLNQRLINWWRVVRDEGEELGHLLEHTPNARDEYKWAIENLDNMELSNAKRALAYHIGLWLGIMPGDGRFQQSNWGIRYKTTNGARKRWYTRDVKILINRMLNVQIENRDAIELLRRLERESDTLIYVDPPYTSADITVYGVYDFDEKALSETLLKQEGKVAISGYNDEWDNLGWDRHEHKTKYNLLKTTGEAVYVPRTEVLWTNYELDERSLF